MYSDSAEPVEEWSKQQATALPPPFPLRAFTLNLHMSRRQTSTLTNFILKMMLSIFLTGERPGQ